MQKGGAVNAAEEALRISNSVFKTPDELLTKAEELRYRAGNLTAQAAKVCLRSPCAASHLLGHTAQLEKSSKGKPASVVVVIKNKISTVTPQLQSTLQCPDLSCSADQDPRQQPFDPRQGERFMRLSPLSGPWN